MRPLLALFLCAVLATPAVAKTPLRDVPEIDDRLMVIAIGNDLRKRCDDIGVRWLRANAEIQSLKTKANDLGYSDAEFDAHWQARAEQDRMRAKAEAWLAARGVDAGNTAAFCAFGRAEIARDSAIGRLLR